MDRTEMFEGLEEFDHEQYQDEVASQAAVGLADASLRVSFGK